MKKINVKKLLKWFIPFLILIVLLFVVPLFFTTHKEEYKMTQYNLDLVYDDQSKSVQGSERVVYFNNSENMFTNLYFHLYPNAFREDSKSKVVASTKVSEAYPNGESYGEILIENVGDDLGELNYEITGEDFNILSIELREAIYPGESVAVNIQFQTILANINHRLGYGERTINIGNFYPIACVYEDGKGFCQSFYHSNGDPFYSDCSNYNVNIEFDNKFQLASSGNLLSSKSLNGRIKNQYSAEKVRDFCLVLSESFDIVSKKVDGIQINYYGYKGDNDLQNSLKVAGDAVETFNEMFGVYPYNQLSIVKSNFLHGGMEFPNLVMISDSVIDEVDYQYVIIHEIAHQWWFGVVGNDQFNHAWQDEALAEYSSLLFFKKNPSFSQDYKQMIASANDSYKLFEEIYTKVQGSVDGKMDRPLNQFQTEPEYVQCTYTKGVLLYDNIYQLIGEKKFFKALKNYYQDFKFKNAMPEDLIASFVKEGGGKIEKIFETWLQGKVVFK